MESILSFPTSSWDDVSAATRRRDVGRDAHMPQNPPDHRRILEDGDKPQSAAALSTRQDVEPERSLHQRRPLLAPRAILPGLRRLPCTSIGAIGLIDTDDIRAPGRPGAK